MQNSQQSMWHNCIANIKVEFQNYLERSLTQNFWVKHNGENFIYEMSTYAIPLLHTHFENRSKEINRSQDNTFTVFVFLNYLTSQFPALRYISTNLYPMYQSRLRASLRFFLGGSQSNIFLPAVLLYSLDMTVVLCFLIIFTPVPILSLLANSNHLIKFHSALPTSFRIVVTPLKVIITMLWNILLLLSLVKASFYINPWSDFRKPDWPLLQLSWCSSNYLFFIVVTILAI